MALFMELLLIGIGLAMDAFSVAVTDGIILKKNRLINAVKIAAFFGVFQFGMLYIGDLLGSAFASYITSLDHWIAFILLVIIGGKMVMDARKGDEDEDELKNPLDNKTLAVLAVATSIDALAVGVSFAAMYVDIIFASAVVGAVAFAFSFAGVYIGNRFGNFLSDKAEIFGGIVLIGIGVKILVEHLFF